MNPQTLTTPQHSHSNGMSSDGMSFDVKISNISLFNHCAHIYFAEASMRDAMSGAAPKQAGDPDLFALTEAQKASSYQVVAAELQSQGVIEPALSSMLWRIEHAADVLRDRAFFSVWPSRGHESAKVQAVSCLILACATANIRRDGATATFDYGDVERLSIEINQSSRAI